MIRMQYSYSFHSNFSFLIINASGGTRTLSQSGLSRPRLPVAARTHISRNDGTWTHNLLIPNQACYQIALHPDIVPMRGLEPPTSATWKQRVCHCATWAYLKVPWMGVEPTNNHRVLSSAALPICVPGHILLLNLLYMIYQLLNTSPKVGRVRLELTMFLCGGFTDPCPRR